MKVIQTRRTRFSRLLDLQPIRRRIFTARRSLLPQTREGWGRAIGAALGSAGAVYMLWHVARAAGVL